jgi:hypothetical protein
MRTTIRPETLSLYVTPTEATCLVLSTSGREVVVEFTAAMWRKLGEQARWFADVAAASPPLTLDLAERVARLEKLIGG